jgi:RNA polymerase sigma factor (sigma-70 family)
MIAGLSRPCRGPNPQGPASTDVLSDEFTLPFIRGKLQKLLGRAARNDSEAEDLVQDFLVNLLARARRFDPARGNWQAFVVVTCQNHFSNIVEYRTAQMRARGREAGSLNVRLCADESPDIGSTLADSQHDIRTGRRTRSREESLDLGEDVAAVVSTFPPRLRELCQRLMSGMSKAAAAKAIGMSQASFYEVLGRIRARFEKAGLRGYL